MPGECVFRWPWSYNIPDLYPKTAEINLIIGLIWTISKLFFLTIDWFIYLIFLQNLRGSQQLIRCLPVLANFGGTQKFCFNTLSSYWAHLQILPYKLVWEHSPSGVQRWVSALMTEIQIYKLVNFLNPNFADQELLQCDNLFMGVFTTSSCTENSYFLL